MTLSQRLTRAGLSFIVFGTAVSLMPTNGMAFSATDNCLTATTHDFVGISATDASTSYEIVSGTHTIVLTATPAGSATADAASDDIAGFKTLIVSNIVTTTSSAAVGVTDHVVVSFSDGRTVSYSVTQK